MKNKLIWLLAYFLSSTSVYSETRPPCFSNPNVVMFYANGMFNKRIESEDSLKLLKMKLEGHFNDKIVSYNNLYNSIDKDSYIDRLMQRIQVVAQEFSETVNHSNNNLSLSEYVLSQIPNIVFPKNSQRMLAKLLTSDDKYSDHLKLMAEAIHLGLNPIVVSHSQGNFYANQVCRSLKEDKDDRIKKFITLNPNYNVQVASPAQEIACGQYFTTFEDDKVIPTVQSILGVMKIPGITKTLGVTNGLTGGLNYDPELGHSIEAYLTHPESSKKIFHDIEETLNQSKVVPVENPLIAINYSDDKDGIIHKIKQPFLYIGYVFSNGAEKVSRTYGRAKAWAKLVSFSWKLKSLSLTDKFLTLRFNQIKKQDVNSLINTEINLDSNEELSDLLDVILDKIVDIKIDNKTQNFITKYLPKIIQLKAQYLTYQKARDGDPGFVEVKDLNFGISSEDKVRKLANNSVGHQISYSCNDFSADLDKPSPVNVKLHYGYDLYQTTRYTVDVKPYLRENNQTISSEIPVYSGSKDLGQKMVDFLDVEIAKNKRSISFSDTPSDPIWINEFQAEVKQLPLKETTETRPQVDSNLYKSCNKLRTMFSDACYKGVVALLNKKFSLQETK